MIERILKTDKGNFYLKEIAKDGCSHILTFWKMDERTYEDRIFRFHVYGSETDGKIAASAIAHNPDYDWMNRDVEAFYMLNKKDLKRDDYEEI